MVLAHSAFSENSIFLTKHIVFYIDFWMIFLCFFMKIHVFFDIDFEIENKFLNILMTKSFQFGLEKIADAFQKRAENL